MVLQNIQEFGEQYNNHGNITNQVYKNIATAQLHYWRFEFYFLTQN